MRRVGPTSVCCVWKTSGTWNISGTTRSSCHAGRPALRLPWTMVRRRPPHAAPAGFIYHMMRCGSTLIARFLQASGRCQVLSEPHIFQKVLCHEASRGPHRARWLQRLMEWHILGLCRSDQPLVVKWAASVNFGIEALREAFPKTPSIFVHRDPVEVLVSTVERPPPDFMPMPAYQLSPEWHTPERSLLSLPEASAQFIASSIDWARAIPDIYVVAYEELPALITSHIAPLFGIALSAADQERLRRSRGARHAKRPERIFGGRTCAASGRHARATPQIRALAESVIEPALARFLAEKPRLSRTSRPSLEAVPARSSTRKRREECSLLLTRRARTRKTPSAELPRQRGAYCWARPRPQHH